MQPTARHFFVALAVGSALALGAAYAQTDTPAQATAATSPASPQLSIRDIYDRVEAAGYRDMREIEYEHGRYEVEARNAQGQRVKLEVNATTGAIERTRIRG